MLASAGVSPRVLVFARPDDEETDVMTAGCTIHLRSGEVEMVVTVGTKGSAALVSVSCKTRYRTDIHMQSNTNLSYVMNDALRSWLTFRYAKMLHQSLCRGMPKEKAKSIWYTSRQKAVTYK